LKLTHSPPCPPQKKYSSTPSSSRPRTRQITTLTSSTKRQLFPSFLILFLTFTPQQLTRYPALNAFEQRTQVPKAYAVLGAFFLLSILLAINPLASPVSNLVGWLLPAYLSFQAIESPSPHDDVQWLTYWVVFGFFNFIESFALRLVLYYFPWYFAFKTLFIVWLQLPAFRVCPETCTFFLQLITRHILQGAQVAYVNVLKPVLANVVSQSRAVAPTTSTTADPGHE
jgi:receptor expression-enhancing protein 5/6